MLIMQKRTQLAEWRALQAHQKSIANQRMQDWFKENPDRFKQFSLSVSDILLDYSKNRVTTETLALLCKLATTANLNKKIEALFSGEIINSTEQRAALHTALRDTQNRSLMMNGKNIAVDIQATLKKIHWFIEQIHTQTWRGSTGKPIRDIVNIGIGGSHLGPLMTLHALADFANPDLRCHFISNVDNTHLHEVLKQIHAETTLFIISSKSFTTLETITNAETIRKWMQQQLGTHSIHQHFIAVTADPLRAVQFGIPEGNIFPLWEWVGGRYSIWSAIGLPLALLIGMKHFEEFLQGAWEMDQHFRYSEFSQNMPVILGLLGIWYINFFGAINHAVIPYSHHLNYLRVYLQQLDMESNGKNVSHQGTEIDFLTGPIILGEQGCNGQHAFHQLLHQGSHFIPVDFILVGKNDRSTLRHQDILISSALSQAQALMQGKSHEQIVAELQNSGLTEKEIEFLAKHKFIPGNRPSNILFLNKMTPRNLGALIALYEHKIFVQGVIWDINSFDQWGVELGKQLLPSILAHLSSVNSSDNSQQDSSTYGLIQYYKNLRDAL